MTKAKKKNSPSEHGKKRNRSHAIKRTTKTKQKNITNSSSKDNSKQVGFLEEKSIPVTKSRKTKMPKAKTAYDKDGNFIVSKIENIKTITTSTKLSGSTNNGFNLYGFKINPGLKLFFPFLSRMAANYLNYEFLKLEYLFVPRGTVNRDGSVMFQAEYNPASKPPENRLEFLNREGAVEAQVFEGIGVQCEQKKMAIEKGHYIRLASVPPGEDIKLYDCATIYFAYDGTPPNTLIGDIYVKYEVKLMNTKFRYGEVQMENIESTKLTTNANTPSNHNPFGVFGSIIGDFAGNFLNTATANLSGNLFSTDRKSVV